MKISSQTPLDAILSQVVMLEAGAFALVKVAALTLLTIFTMLELCLNTT